MNEGRSSCEVVAPRIDLLMVGLALLITWAPVPFGSNRPWAWSLLGCWSAALLLLWSVEIFLGKRRIVWQSAFGVPLAIFALLVGYVVSSTIPGIGPAHPIWSVASEVLGRPLPGRLTMSVEATVVALMRLTTYATILWLTVQLCRDRSNAYAMLRTIIAISAILAIYGLVSYFSGNSHILWFERWTGQIDVTSTFVNRNHYSTFAAIGLICSLAMAVSTFRTDWSIGDRTQRWPVRVIESFMGKTLWYAVATLLIATAWLQTHSRLGALSGLIGLAVLLMLLWATGMVKRLLAVWSVAIMGICMLFAVSGGNTLARFQVDTGPDDRAALFEIVAEQIEAAPLTGSGYGTFEQSFMMYRDLRLANRLIYREAHNSYLEIAAELGIVGAIALVFLPFSCVVICAAGAYRRRKDRLFPIVAISCSAVVGAHSIGDFSIQIPAIAVTYVAILGIGVAQSWSSAQP